MGGMLNSIGTWSGLPDGISETVGKALWKERDDAGKETDVIDSRFVQWFPLDDLKCDPARFEHEAYVARESMNAFEIGEQEEIWGWLTPEEYGALPAEEKRAYAFYRWTNPFGEYGMKCRLQRISAELANMYQDTVLIHEDGYPQVAEMRIVVRLG